MRIQSILLSLPSDDVKIDGQRYIINTDFRVFVKFELLMQDSSVSDEEKLPRVLNEFYNGKIPENFEAAADEMLKIYTRGKDINSCDDDGISERSGRMIYSYEHDGDAIFAAFLQCYGVDLSSAKMHWWEFKALFDNLSPDCEFMRAVSYRSMKISGKLPPEEQKRLRQLKEFYALPDNRTADQKERDFANDIAEL